MEAFWKPPLRSRPSEWLPVGFAACAKVGQEERFLFECALRRCLSPRPIWARAWMPAGKSDVPRPRRPDTASLATRLKRPQGEDGQPDEIWDERSRVKAPPTTSRQSAQCEARCLQHTRQANHLIVVYLHIRPGERTASPRRGPHEAGIPDDFSLRRAHSRGAGRTRAFHFRLSQTGLPDPIEKDPGLPSSQGVLRTAKFGSEWRPRPGLLSI
jgi:hypothetical protein